MRISRAVGLLGAVLPFTRKSYCSEVNSGQYKAHRIDRQTSIKTIHFVRHAEGHHNVAGKKDPLFGYRNEDLEDATLTEIGYEQCRLLKESNEEVVKNAQLLVVSPLRRTMQTATHSFPQLQGKIPWVAVECLRERTGLHPCDRRKSISEHQEHFNFIDFSEIKEDKDPLYYKFILREPDHDVTLRTRQFMEWLKNRPEDEIIVVSHHGYLMNLFQNSIVTTEPNKNEKPFENCEIRSFVVNF
jgi:broad specificity phosphatase PhoE